MARTRVVLLPGAVLPAELAYRDLQLALGPAVDAVAKDLELYADRDADVDYALDLEIGGVLREANARGWDRFHLVGYSAGGAAALAVTARHPERLLSLALLEPAWAGEWDWTPRHRAFWDELRRLDSLPAEDYMAGFVRLAVAPGVELPEQPPGADAPWMAQRPAGIRAVTRAFESFALDRHELTRFTRPVYLALGGLSNPAQYREIADRLGGVFADYQLELFPERHHFDPPHRAEPGALARSLLSVWSRAEQAAPR